MQYQFFNDYSEAAHPACLAAVARDALVQEAGYGLDRVSTQARRLIADFLGWQAKSEAELSCAIHWVTGGTQANATFFASVLRPHHAVIAPTTGHIAVHETGAIEATGHKVIAVDTPDGKLTPSLIEAVLQSHPNEHSVKPAWVFISQATEWGGVYSQAELLALRACCDQWGLGLYLDGARLAVALVCSDADAPFVARIADAFYLGATKNGALLGEAVVITRQKWRDDFRYVCKQRGALLAKGRVIASQFVALLGDTAHPDLYRTLAREAVARAQSLAQGLQDLGVRMAFPSPSNQIFPILSRTQADILAQTFGFYIWQPWDEQSVVLRLVTSWATPQSAVDDLLNHWAALLGSANTKEQE